VYTGANHPQLPDRGEGTKLKGLQVALGELNVKGHRDAKAKANAATKVKSDIKLANMYNISYWRQC